MSEAAASASFMEREVMMTRAPPLARALALSNPIPVFPPVTTAVFPDRSTPATMSAAVNVAPIDLD
jgi:hypothetical protein